MFTTKNTLASATFAIALGTASTMAVAGEPTLTSDGKHELKVEYADLNLSKPEGMETLKRRINTASKKVCFVSNGKVPLSEAAKSRECVKETAAPIQAEFGNKAMTQSPPPLPSNYPEGPAKPWSDFERSWNREARPSQARPHS